LDMCSLDTLNGAMRLLVVSLLTCVYPSKMYFLL
jgi:hypothetical protein